MKNFVIIGGSSGIGKALSIQLSQHNNVWATYHKTTPDFEGEHLSFHALDVLDDAPDFSFLPDRIDGLVYCPGSIQLKPFGRLKIDSFEADFQLQVMGAVKTIQSCLPGLKNSEHASVVMYSTVAVQSGFSFHTQVAISKGAIEGLTRSLAAEFAPSVRFNCVAPSLTDTPLAGRLVNTEEKKEVHGNRHPMKRIGQPEDIASISAFLLSKDSSWMTGQIIHCDGGLSTLKV